MPNYAWVSFATDDGPLGVVFTKLRDEEQGDSPLAAMLFVNRLHREGLNPGGEAQWLSVPEEMWASQPGWDWLSQHSERLLSPLELVLVGYLKVSDFGPEGQAQLRAKLTAMMAPDTGITHAEGECDVCDDARTAERLLAEAARPSTSPEAKREPPIGNAQLPEGGL